MIQVSDFQGNISTIPVKFYPDGMVHINHADVPKPIFRMALRSSSAVDFYAFQHLLHALKRRGRCVESFIPSFPGARQDRLNAEGDYLDTAYRNIELLQAASCAVLDPHSLTVRSCADSVIEAADCIQAPPLKYAAVIAPDVGASHRASLVAKKLKIPVFQAWKKRDISTGKLSGFGCEALLGVPTGARVLVVDDICDGGGTFIGLAQHMGRPYDMHLWVTHGYFTQGIAELKKHYSHIYTTDSIAAAPRDGVIEIPIVSKWLKGEI